MNIKRLLLASVALTTLSLGAWADVTDVTDTYIKNAGFDVESDWASSTYWDAQGTTNTKNVTGWTPYTNSATSWASAASLKFGSGVVIYSKEVPALNSEGKAEGGCLALSVAWNQTLYYSQEVKLGAGYYTFSYVSYNPGDGTDINENFFGFESKTVTSYGTLTTFPKETWNTESVSFLLTEETTGTFKLGYHAIDQGTTRQPRTFIDYVKLYFKPLWDVYSEEAEATLKETATGADLERDAINKKISDTTDPTDDDAGELKELITKFESALEIESEITTAKAINGTMYTGASKNLSDAISAAENRSGKTLDEYKTLLANLKEAETAANASIKEYTEIAKYEYITTVQAKADKLDDDGQAAFKTNIEAVKTSVTNCEYENTTAYENAVDAAYVSAVKSQTTIGTDLTELLSNPHFNTSDVSAWTITGSNPKVDVSSHNCEFYEKTFDMSQTIKGMKKGTYEISLQAFQRPGSAQDVYTAYVAGNAKSYATLYTSGQQVDVKNIGFHAATGTAINSDDSKVTVNNETYYLPNSMAGAKVWFGKTYKDEDGNDVPYYTATVEAVVATDGGDLTFGFKGALPSKGWLIFDNFTLKYKSSEAKVDEAESEALLKTVPTTDVYNKDIKADVDKWSAALTEDKTNAEAYVNLLAAIKKADASISAYAPVEAILEQVKGIVESSNFYSDEALKEYYTVPKENYEKCTMTDEEATAYAVTGKAGTAANLMMSLWDVEPANDAAYYTNTWSTEGDNDGSEFATPFYEYYTDNKSSLGAKTLTGTYTADNLEANKYYRVKARVRVRVKDYDTNAPYGVKLQVNEGEIVDVSLGTKYPKAGDFYIETVAANAKPVDGKLVVKFIVDEDNNISWLSFRDVNIEESTLASTSEAATLKKNIEDAKTALAGYTLGFEKGECAPYKVTLSTIRLNRIENIVNLEAVDIDQLTYESVKAKYDGVDWAANSESVNAVYDGTFANAKVDGAPLGWISTHSAGLGTATHPRAFVGDSRLSEFNETNSAFFIRFDNNYSVPGTMYKYGTTEGYTMPLKANSVYYVKADYKGWGSTGLPLRLNATGDYYYTENTTGNADTDNVEPQHFYIIFKTGEAKDYTISFQNSGAKETKNAVVSNIELKSIPEETRTTTTDKYGTICLPYAFTAEGATVYSVATVKDNVVELTEETSPEAGVAYIYLATSSAQTFKVAADGIAVSAPVASTNEINLAGVFEDTKATAGTYVMQTLDGGQKFYYVAEGHEPTIGAYHAYLNVPAATTSESALRISFGNETTTGVEAVKALTDGTAVIYDLNGRKLNKLQKGINIVNGVKVIVK